MRSDALDGAPEDTGPVGPVAICALLFLLAASPLMRGGNRHVAMIVIEAAALAFLAALSFRAGVPRSRPGLRSVLIALLVTSPLWLGLAYLLPLPSGAWNALPGRALYGQLLSTAGLPQQAWLPASLAPDATLVSVLAGIPVAAAFIAGLGVRLPQLKLVLKVLVGAAFVQVMIGLLQSAGGSGSSLYFNVEFGGRPVGTFANTNHFANYIAMALAAYVWLAWMKLREGRRHHHHGHAAALRRAFVIWGAGAVLLLVGILVSRSRGAAIAGLPAAMAAIGVALTVGSRGRAWRTTLLILAGVLGVGVALVGIDALVAKFSFGAFAKDASFRTLLASTSLTGAWEFWPLGAGWGTYAEVYPRFQPASIVGAANYAHQDYAQMLFEGGIFAALLMAGFAWLAITRAVELVRAAVRNRRLRREEMAATICGIGLSGFLLHSLVEFNMHIPANAIVAALFAGIYLRPLPHGEDVPGD